MLGAARARFISRLAGFLHLRLRGKDAAAPQSGQKPELLMAPDQNRGIGRSDERGNARATALRGIDSSGTPAAALQLQRRHNRSSFMSVWNALKLRLGAAASRRVSPYQDTDERPLEDEGQGRDPRRLFLVIGLGALSWVATYVGMLELIESNLGDLPFIHKVIIGFSVAMLMTMIIWLLDKMFAPADLFTKACYVAGYLFLSIISVGFGFGFY